MTGLGRTPALGSAALWMRGGCTREKEAASDARVGLRCDLSADGGGAGGCERDLAPGGGASEPGVALGCPLGVKCRAHALSHIEMHSHPHTHCLLTHRFTQTQSRGHTRTLLAHTQTQTHTVSWMHTHSPTLPALGHSRCACKPLLSCTYRWGQTVDASGCRCHVGRCGRVRPICLPLSLVTVTAPRGAAKGHKAVLGPDARSLGTFLVNSGCCPPPRLVVSSPRPVC